MLQGDLLSSIVDQSSLLAGPCNELLCSKQSVSICLASQVVQGMLLTRPGFEERVKGTSNMQEMLKWLPSDMFRTCLARVSLSALFHCHCQGIAQQILSEHAWLCSHAGILHRPGTASCGIIGDTMLPVLPACLNMQLVLHMCPCIVAMSQGAWHASLATITCTNSWYDISGLLQRSVWCL